MDELTPWFMLLFAMFAAVAAVYAYWLEWQMIYIRGDLAGTQAKLETREDQVASLQARMKADRERQLESTQRMMALFCPPLEPEPEPRVEFRYMDPETFEVKTKWMH